MRTVKKLLILLIVSSCASVQVEYDYDRTVDFSAYKTYNYYSDLETGLSELDTRRLLKSFDEVMLVKGLSLSAEPDFYINISSNEYDSPNRSSVGVGVGGSGRNVGGGVSVGIPMESRYHRQIRFDFIDEDGRGLFWQAISESSYNPEANPEQREMNLRQIVDEVLKGYPPAKR